MKRLLTRFAPVVGAVLLGMAATLFVASPASALTNSPLQVTNCFNGGSATWFEGDDADDFIGQDADEFFGDDADGFIGQDADDSVLPACAT